MFFSVEGKEKQVAKDWMGVKLAKLGQVSHLGGFKIITLCEIGPSGHFWVRGGGG